MRYRWEEFGEDDGARQTDRVPVHTDKGGKEGGAADCTGECFEETVGAEDGLGAGDEDGEKVYL